MRIASLRALFIAASLLSAGAEAFAAGLGRLEVLTALGAPLRAEIAVIADKNEIPSLSAKIAPPAAFQNAGLIYSSAVAEMRVAIDKRTNGEPYLSVTTTNPLNEPVLDLLIELSWSSGRVIREYTAFVDPPHLFAERAKQREAAAAAAAKPTTGAAPPQPAPKPEPLPEPAAAQPEAPIPTTPADVTSEAAPEPTAAAPPASAPEEPSKPVETIGGTAPTLLIAGDASSIPAVGGESYGPTKRGDTLSKIALAAKPADVTLEQMLVLLFRNNPDAFSGKNMNRLKTGKIIRLPDPSAYGAISARDARKEVRLQSANWNAYRERLAAKVAQEMPVAPEAQQAVAGQVTPKIEDKAAPAAEPKEVVKLSKGEPGVAAAGASAADRAKALEEELVARDKALKESNERVAKLEKTIKDLQALVEVKNQGMAELQRQAAAGAAPAKSPATAQPTAPTKPEAKPAQPGPPPGAPQASKPTPTAPTPPTAALATPPGEQVAPKPAAPPATPAPQAVPAPAQKPRPRSAPPPPPEPGLLDTVLSQPTYLVAGALIVGLIGLLAVRTVRRRRESRSKSDEVAPAISALGAAGASHSLGPTETDVGLATRNRDIAEEVDPLEEAEIFLAYGRDAQAEELLKEAIAANPRRYEIHGKLLEIYARRKNVNAFEQVAREVQQGTGGQGEVWSRVVALGYQIDPQNPRYAAGRGAAAPIAEQPGAPSAADRVDLEVGLRGDETESSTATDIDLGDTVRFERTQMISPGGFGAGEATEPAAAASVDLNIDLPAAGPGGAAEPGAPSFNAIDFDFDIGKVSPGEPAPAAASAPSSGAADSGLDFDVGTLSLDAGEPKPSPAAAAVPSIDLTGISLDLEGTTTTLAGGFGVGKDEKWYEVQTKFDLAKAYQEMGDKDGAREILQEVIAEGDAEQKAAAQAVLASLG